jgi:hypothetical protein
MSIALKISVSGGSIEKEFDIDLYVRPQRDFIRWKQAVTADELQVSYLQGQRIYSDEAIELIDHIYDFSATIDPVIKSTRSNEVISSKENLIFTTITNSSNGNKIPMFYGHRIQVKAENVNFFPWNKNPQESFFYIEDYNLVVSDLENDLNVIEKIFNPSFVQYTCAENTISVKAGQVISEIYKREPVYKLATIEDIDPVTFDFRVDRLVYEREKIDGTNLYRYTIYKNNPTDVVYYKEHPDYKVKVSLDNKVTLDSPWHLNLDGGKISVKKIGTESGVYTYNWDDPDGNIYFPSYGFIKRKVKAAFLNENSFIVPYRNIIQDYTKNIHITYKVIRNEKKGPTVIFARTTVPFLIGKKISGNYSDKNIVKYGVYDGSYDPNNGVITTGTAPPIKEKDMIIVEYFTYSTNGIKLIDNLNPLHKKGMESGSYLYYASPYSEDNYSVINWVKLNKLYNSVLEEFDLYVSDVKDLSLSSFIGKRFAEFSDAVLLYNPYTLEQTEPDSLQLPIATVSFKKRKYIDSVRNKDLRVYAGVKNDLEIENRGNDFAFSEILNPVGYYNLSLENQIAVLYDESEIPNYTEFDYKSVIKTALGAGLLPHFRSQGHPIIVKAEGYKSEAKVYLSLTTEKCLGNLDRIKLYWCVNGESYSPNDPLISNQLLDEVYDNGNTTFIIELAPGNGFNAGTPVSDQLLGNKLYVYFTWSEAEGLYESGRSPIHCINIKE